MRHRNVVHFIGAVVEQPNLCVVMEFMAAGSLTIGTLTPTLTPSPQPQPLNSNPNPDPDPNPDPSLDPDPHPDPNPNQVNKEMEIPGYHEGFFSMLRDRSTRAGLPTRTT